VLQGVIGLSGLGVLTACHGHRPPPVRSGAAALDAALAAEDDLVAAYTRALVSGSPAASRPLLRLLRSHHAVHRDALVAAGARRTVPAPTPTPATAPPASALHPLARAEHTSGALAADAAIAAPAATAPLFASIAASHAANRVLLVG
jgi:hypothetical protein